MIIKTFTFNPFSTNCYVVESEGDIVVIDPSSQSDHEHRQLIGAIEAMPGTLRRILLTHAHIDHIFGCARLAEHFGIGIEVHADEVLLLERAETQAAMFGVDMEAPPAPSALIQPGSPIEFGSRSWDVLHTPGHSPGSVTFVDREEGVAFAGDVLFAGSIGRTDLWQGSLPVLMQSIFTQLVPLGDAMRIYPGHGPSTTIGREVRANPFLTGGAPL